MIESLIIAAVCLFAYMTCAFIIALIKKDNGVADIAYGGGFVLVSWVTYALGLTGLAGLIASILVTLWAARLSYRIYRRNHGKPEDFRYRTWREEWGKSFVVRSFFQVFMLQGAILFLVALPVLLLNTFDTSAAVSVIALIGIFIWLKGFFFETVADRELDEFLKDPGNKGKIMSSGLWRYSRHPNYYGESVMWWGIALIAFGTLLPQTDAVLAALSFVSPVLITFLLLKVSGIPLVEKRFEGELAWEAYKAKTSAFIPWFPKR